MITLYPAIDLKAGRVVRLLQGKPECETVYFQDPHVPAARWKEAGADWVHVVDLDGAFNGKPFNIEAIKKIVAAGAKVQLGGGIRNVETVAQSLELGVNRVVVGTSAASEPDFVKELVDRYGEKVAIGIDAKNGKVAIKGWVEESTQSALALAKKMDALGVRTIIYTDISRDGMLTGPNFAAQKEMLETVSANVIASGGISSAQDIKTFLQLANDYSNLEGVIIGKALYEGRIDLKQLLQLVSSKV